jgi:hypothetical protein
MSIDNDSGRDREWTNHELVEMDRDTAERTLTKVQFDRWEKLQSLHDQAEANRQQWADQEAEVSEITVSADMETLGTEVDIFDNQLLVHVDPENRGFQQASQRLESVRDQYADVDAEDMDTDIPAEDRDELRDALTEMLDHAIMRWDGTEWNRLDDATRESVLADAVERWGLVGLLYAWLDIAEAIERDRHDRMETIESFR